VAEIEQRSTPTAGTVVSPDAPAVCMSCGGPHARQWSSREGIALLCPTCATLHGLGCP
jgi:hypothetical protein